MTSNHTQIIYEEDMTGQPLLVYLMSIMGIITAIGLAYALYRLKCGKNASALIFIPLINIGSVEASICESMADSKERGQATITWCLYGGEWITLEDAKSRDGDHFWSKFIAYFALLALLLFVIRNSVRRGSLFRQFVDKIFCEISSESKCFGNETLDLANEIQVNVRRIVESGMNGRQLVLACGLEKVIEDLKSEAKNHITSGDGNDLNGDQEELIDELDTHNLSDDKFNGVNCELVTSGRDELNHKIVPFGHKLYKDVINTRYKE